MSAGDGAASYSTAGGRDDGRGAMVVDRQRASLESEIRRAPAAAAGTILVGASRSRGASPRVGKGG